ncbi:hypothetical protein LG3211_1533 [Lysobacter gummosus]|nr:hypothetical protein LG3211_1533 [Lysobacter gummosus]
MRSRVHRPRVSQHADRAIEVKKIEWLIFRQPSCNAYAATLRAG